MSRRDSDVFGKLPAGATHWSVRRKTAYTWEWCTFALHDGVARQEFPIGELSLQTIRDRWGTGTYRVMFLALARGTRQVFGNGKIFELTASHRGGTPKPAGRTAIAREDDPLQVEPAAPEDHSQMVRVMLKAAQGKHSPAELFETLAIPMGMGLSSLFSSQDRLNERLDLLEQRLAAIEARLAEPEREEPTVDRLGRLLDRLEAIEPNLARAAAPPARRPSPGRKTPR